MSKKTIYKFEIKREEEVEEESTRNKKNKETGEMEKVTTTKTVTKEIPYTIKIHEPSRRQVEEADMEFSIEMSKCIKRGILTKAMLAKKYSDSGGLLTEDDSKELIRLYKELAETQTDLARLISKKKKSAAEKEKEGTLTESFADLRKKIVDLETTYQNVFNHTADTKAQNKTILYYMLTLAHIEGPDGEISPMFPGDKPQDREESYYEIDESDDEIYELAREKLMTFISFWYFSQNATEEDFSKLEEDMEAGAV
jgi:DNA-binding XRE family transcriptional regulator